MRKAAAVITLLFLVLASYLLAAEKDLLEWQHPFGLASHHPYGILTGNYVSPHVKWGKPLAGGAVKVLLLAPTRTHRETIELAQRLSIDYTAWMCESFVEAARLPGADMADQSFTAPPDVVMQALEDALKPEKTYDVIIVGKLLWEIVPPEKRFEILKRVSEGAGLVYINPPRDDPELKIVFGKNPTEEWKGIVSGVPISHLPRTEKIAPDKLVRTFRYGKGRVVGIYYDDPKPRTGPARAGYHSLTPNWVSQRWQDGWPRDAKPEPEFTYYEYYQSLLAKAVVYAGRRDTGAAIYGANVDEKIAWEDVPNKVVALSYEPLKNVSGDLEARLAVRNIFGEVAVEDRRPATLESRKAYETVVHLSLAQIPAGGYFADTWLENKSTGEIYDWASAYFEVTADVDITSIETPPDASYQAGDSVTGNVILSRPPKIGEKVIVSLWDNFGRKIQEVELTPEGQNASFSLGPLEPLTNLHEVRARIEVAGAVLSEKRHSFPVRLGLREDDFSFVLWGDALNSLPHHLMLRKLHDEDGADAIDDGPRYMWYSIDRPEDAMPVEVEMEADLKTMAIENIRPLPYNNRFGVLGAGPDHIVTGWREYPSLCMTNPGWLSAIERGFSVDGRLIGRYGAFAYTHGDETLYSFDPDLCWSETCLAHLREFLRGRYASLDNLNKEWKTDFKSWEEIKPITFKEAKETANYARWLDHRLAQDEVFANFYKTVGDYLRKFDPEARTGFDGFGSPLLYPNCGADWWKIAHACDLLQTYPGLQMEIWRSFASARSLRGMWYGTYGPGWDSLWSTIENGHRFVWYSLFQGLNSAWFWVMQDPGGLCGYSSDLTSTPFFESTARAVREVKRGPARLLLSGVRSDDGIAIHFSESSRILDSFFAEKEGAWSTNYERALEDFTKALEDAGFQYRFLSYAEVENGALLTRGYKVFVMPHSRAVSPREAEEIRKFIEGGGVIIADILPGTHNEHGTPQAQGFFTDIFKNTELLAVNSFREGKAVLVGDTFRGYAEKHSKGWEEIKGQYEPLQKLLEREAGLKPFVRVSGASGKDVPPTEVHHFICGEIDFVGLLRDYFLRDNKPYEVVVGLPKKAHLYDVRRGEYIGFVSSVPLTIDYEAALLAMSPYKVGKVEVALDRKTLKPGESLNVEAQVKVESEVSLSRHVFRLEITGSDGKPLSHYSQNLLAEEGKGNATLHLALNEKPGNYTVTIRDVMSGEEGRETITIGR